MISSLHFMIYPFFWRATCSKISSSWSSVKPITFSAILRLVPALDSPPKNTFLRKKSFFSRPRNASTMFGGIFVERLKWENFNGENTLCLKALKTYFLNHDPFLKFFKWRKLQIGSICLSLSYSLNGYDVIVLLWKQKSATAVDGHISIYSILYTNATRLGKLN